MSPPAFRKEASEQLTVFHDGSCPLCRAEVAALTSCDAGGRVRWVDCADPAFERSLHAAPPRTELMRALHVRLRSGKMVVGVDGFAALYEAVGHSKIAAALRFPPIRLLARWAYPMVVRMRPWLARRRWPYGLLKRLERRVGQG